MGAPTFRPPSVAILLVAGALLSVLGCAQPPASPGTSGSKATHVTSGPTVLTDGATTEHLGSVEIGGRLDGEATYLDAPGRLEYAFDVSSAGGRLRVSLDMSNRDDCISLAVIDPAGARADQSVADYPVVCPSSGGGQVFDIEQSVEDAASGRWTAAIDAGDVRGASLRLRVALGPTDGSGAGGQLDPDLVPWLPYEFGFVTPISGSPGTAHDRDNGPGDPSLSCHPVEEPDDQRCLRFSAGVYNAGAGPMYIEFRDDVAYQHVYTADATARTYHDNEAAAAFEESEAGTGEWHPFHQHRHLAEFVLYELYEVVDGSGTLVPIDTGGKHGYCTFSQHIMDWDAVDQDPQYASFPTGEFCADAMTLERGWGDIYRWQRPGQYVRYDQVEEPDGSMRAGSYLVRVTVDPMDRIVETDESNNVGYARIDIVDHGEAADDAVIVCEQGLGTDPWDPARQLISDRFAWARLAADPSYAPPTCG